MHRLVPVPLVGALLLGCTHDFDQFEPVSGATATTTTTSGSGGATTTTGGGGGGGHGVGGATTTSSGGHGGGGVEDCLDGKDDDGDGKADCADPKCAAGFACSPPLQQGMFAGPAWLFDGADGQAPSCGGQLPQLVYEGHRDLVSTPAVCGKCTCDAATGTCNLGNLKMYTDGSCQQAAGQAPLAAANQCNDVNAFNANSYIAAPPTFAGGSCQPNQPGLSKPAPSWGTKGVLCQGATSQAGCAPGGVCTPRPVAPFGATLCVWAAGDQACPAGYPDKHSFWDGYTDTRDCSICACGQPNATCTATTTLYDKQSCQGKFGNVADDGQCHQVGNASRMRTQVTVTGTCAPSGGAPTGTVIEGPARTTVCCTK